MPICLSVFLPIFLVFSSLVCYNFAYLHSVKMIFQTISKGTTFQYLNNVLSSLEGGVIPEIMAPEKGEETEVVKKKPSIPLKDIVQEKFVICLDSSSTARKK